MRNQGFHKKLKIAKNKFLEDYYNGKEICIPFL